MCVDNHPDLKTIFTSNVEISITLRVEPRDIFAQKSSEEYQGSVQINRVRIVLSPSATARPAAAAPPAPAAQVPPP